MAIDIAKPILNGKATTNGHTSTNPYKVQEVPFKHERPLKVVCIGAGFSGLYLALRLQQRCKNVELIIYEKNHEIGGTWLENVYPGVACDVPSHIYCYTFEPDSEWTEHYAKGEEILQYLKRCAIKFKARQFIRFNHKVTAAKWNEEIAKWEFDIESSDGSRHDSADVFINGCGFLNSWKWPSIKGLNDFQGKLMHTAAWDKSFDYKGKSVAVIGSGSSALQVIPNVLPDVTKLDAYIRSPTYIPLPMAYEYLEENHADGYKGDRKYSEADKQRFREDPEYWKKYRKYLETNFNRFFEYFTKGSAYNAELRDHALKNMAQCLGARTDLLQHLTPDWEVGCRRLSPGLGFLEALTSPKTEVIKDEIDCFVLDGIKTADGKLRAVDVIVCATGFDCSFKPAFQITGRDGFVMDEAWAEEPRSYISIGIENMPNYFVFNGPYCCTGNGSVIPCIEKEGDYMINCINKIQQENIRSMVPKLKAITEFSEHADTLLKRSTWSGGCRSWYKTKSGRVVGVWPGPSLAFMELMKNPRWEDYEFEYIEFENSNANRWSFLGNGFTAKHAAGEVEDLAPYLDDTVPATL